MPEFISKLQYKIYEKGEFSDEKARTLEETLDLIKKFPWVQQRGADVQLTGPSVTIQNEYVEYLKLGLFFNGKFCLYYYDRNNHLFELHVPTLEDACHVVTDFFNGLSIEEKFDKHLFNIGAKGHFETAAFEYRVHKLATSLYFLLIALLSCIALLATVAFFKMDNAPIPLLVLDIFLDILCLQSFYFMVRLYLKSKDMYLQLSTGSLDFQFGDNEQSVITYHKKDIAAINVYGGTSRSSKLFKVMEIIFNNGSKTIFSGSLINPDSFVLKFPGLEIYYVTKSSAIWKMIWKFSK
jgi:hypothetical protein